MVRARYEPNELPRRCFITPDLGFCANAHLQCCGPAPTAPGRAARSLPGNSILGRFVAMTRPLIRFLEKVLFFGPNQLGAAMPLLTQIWPAGLGWHLWRAILGPSLKNG